VVRNEIDRVPYSLEAEEAVLGSLLLTMGNPINEEAFNKVMQTLKPKHFYRDKNQFVYAACLSLHRAGWPIDQVTVAHELQRQGVREAVGVAYLSHLIHETPTSIYLEYYARIVIDTHKQRKKLEELWEER